MRLRRPGHAWVALCLLAAALASLAYPLQRDVLDWQPGLAAAQPWRWWSAALTHLSALHLGANLAGTALVAALGWVGQLSWRSTLAWALAWPLTHLALLLRPELTHYGGLSGVLHAGVAVAALTLCVEHAGRTRWVALAVLAGLLAKVASEAPWGPVLRHAPGWDIAIAPLAHATGTAAGLLCAAVMLGLSRGRQAAGARRA